jgi:hypothetical protein
VSAVGMDHSSLIASFRTLSPDADRCKREYVDTIMLSQTRSVWTQTDYRFSRLIAIPAPT